MQLIRCRNAAGEAIRRPNPSVHATYVRPVLLLFAGYAASPASSYAGGKLLNRSWAAQFEGVMREEDQMSDMSDEELQAIAAREAATTPGPWTSYFEGRDQMGGASFICTGTQDLYIHAEDYAGGGGHFCADQDFIAHAKQDVPRLIAEIKRLRARLSDPREPR